MKGKFTRNKIWAGFIALAMIITCIPAQNAAAEAGDLLTATNISFETARELAFGTSIGEEMSDSDSFRYYKFSLDGASELYISGTTSSYLIACIYIYDAARTQIYYDSVHYSFTTDPVCLTGGDYYIKLEYSESITFKITSNSLSESFTETQGSNNNIAANASVIALSTQYKGVLAQNDDTDFYRFQVPSDGKITFNMTNAAKDTIKYIIYDSSLNGSHVNTISHNKKASDEITLTAGTYYLAITKQNLESSVGSYNFSIDFVRTVSGSQTDTSGSGSNTSQTVSGSNSTAPARPTIISVKNTAKKKMTVRWRRVRGIGGYQLQYSKNKNFKKGVIKETLSPIRISASYFKLTKGKKYYVRIRSYKMVKSKRKYSKWSAKKSVKIKK